MPVTRNQSVKGVHILADRYTCAEIFALSQSKIHVEISDNRLQAVRRCRQFLEEKLADPTAIYYGINTGFGALCNTIIDTTELEALQENLINSHATGMGATVPQEIVRIMVLLKALNLSEGYSGVRPDVVAQLIALLNAQITPVIYELGSLGASGDLAPLAHLALVLCAGGEATLADGTKLAGAKALAHAGIAPLKLQSKEGLALLNGTQFMTAYGTWLVAHSKQIYDWAQAIAALSCEAFLVSDAPFSAALHATRPHKGQVAAADGIRAWRRSSTLAGTSGRVQDPYSFRCIPQVHGASADVINYAEQVFETEINATTDNPILFPDDDTIISGGNFHGQPLALALDFLAIGLAELGSISERRTYQLLSGASGLSPFLAQKPGLESGLMIAQYLAASIVSANKQLCTPASVDTIPSSNGQEDHVSMGANAATKCYRVAENIYRVLAVELLTACTALTDDRLSSLAPALKSVVTLALPCISTSRADRYLSPELHNLENLLRTTTAPIPA